MTTCTSLRRPLANVGRSGRSISRQVRIASSLGRPSRRKNEPGIRPAAYIRSSTSTVSGKKSNCSLGCLLAVVAERTTVSPSWASADPAACRASRPVEKTISRVPNEPLSITARDCCAPRFVAVVVVLVRAQVLGEVLNALGEHRDLHLRRTGVALGGRVVLHDLLLHSGFERHCLP